MSERTLHAALLHFRHLSSEGLTDRQLLERFANLRDESAFAALLHRHGPLVLGTCRRILRQEQDAEDTFQATFGGRLEVSSAHHAWCKFPAAGNLAANFFL